MEIDVRCALICALVSLEGVGRLRGRSNGNAR